MKSQSWQNPYIDLVAQKSEYIIAGSSYNHPINREYIDEKLADYQEILCEPCCGSGEHLVTLAQKNPQTLCVGFEQRYKRAYSVANKAEQLCLKNILVIQGDAASIGETFLPRKLKAVYLNFPDPWEKRRLQKHRLLTTKFVETVSKLLENNGIFSYKTDHRGCFEEAVSIIQGQNDLRVSAITYDLYSSDYLTENIPTEFERLFKNKGLPIHMLIAQKTPTNSN